MARYHPERSTPLQILPTGEVRQVRTFFPCTVPSDPTNNPYDEETWTLAAADGSTLSHEVRTSRVMAQPTRWKVTGTDILNTNSTGRSWNLNEAWRFDATLVPEMSCNPTMGGATPEFFPANFVWTGPDHRCSQWSPVVFYKAVQNGNRLRLQGCTIPLEFATAGLEYRSEPGLTSDALSTDMQTLVLYHKCRQYLDIEWNWRPDIHRQTFWFYCPVGFNTRGLYRLSGGPSLTDLFFQTAGVYDMKSRVLTLVDDNAWVNFNSIEIKVMRDWTRYDGSDPIVVSQALGSLAPSGYTGTLVTSPSAPCVIGMAARLGRHIQETSSIAGEDRRLAVLDSLGLFQGRLPGHPAADVYTGTGQTLNMQAQSEIGRVPGWIPLRSYIVTAATSTVAMARYDDLFRSRILDDDKPSELEIPQPIRDGVDPVYGDGTSMR